MHICLCIIYYLFPESKVGLLKQRACDLQSLKYLVFGLLEKKFASSALDYHFED